MRGIAGRVCHGPKRGPRQPHSVIEPALRLGAWSLLFVGSAAAFAAIVAAFLGWQGVVVSLLYAVVTSWTGAIVLGCSAPIGRTTVDLDVYDPGAAT